MAVRRTNRLTPAQHAVMKAMADGEPLNFLKRAICITFVLGDDDRRVHHNVVYSLKRRDLIEKEDGNSVATWYRVTEKGRAALAETDPQGPPSSEA